jgi:mRNA interferase RelE/StbE
VAEYSLAIKPSARKELDDLADALFRRIEQKILMLAVNPRPPGCRKLKGHSDIWRIRVGDYRVLYTVDDAEMVVRISRIAHRREVYE